jgi:hypothetical protein
MTELLRLLCFRHPTHVIELLRIAKLQEFTCFPQIVDSGTNGWWHCSTLGANQPSTICVWLEGRRVTFQFEDGVLKSILAPATAEVSI